MAKQVKKMPPPNRRDRYPWSDWCNGRPWKVYPRKEFRVEPASFRRYVVLHARRKGLRVATRVVGVSVTFQFSAKESP